MNSSLNAHDVVKITSMRRVFKDFSALVLVATDSKGHELSKTIYGSDRQAPVIEVLEDHIVETENAPEVS